MHTTVSLSWLTILAAYFAFAFPSPPSHLPFPTHLPCLYLSSLLLLSPTTCASPPTFIHLPLPAAPLTYHLLYFCLLYHHAMPTSACSYLLLPASPTPSFLPACCDLFTWHLITIPLPFPAASAAAYRLASSRPAAALFACMATFSPIMSRVRAPPFCMRTRAAAANYPPGIALDICLPALLARATCSMLLLRACQHARTVQALLCQRLSPRWRTFADGTTAFYACPAATVAALATFGASRQRHNRHLAHIRQQTTAIFLPLKQLYLPRSHLNSLSSSLYLTAWCLAPPHCNVCACLNSLHLTLTWTDIFHHYWA